MNYISHIPLIDHEQTPSKITNGLCSVGSIFPPSSTRAVGGSNEVLVSESPQKTTVTGGPPYGIP